MTIDPDKLKALARITIEIEPETSDPIESFGYATDAENQEAAQYVRDLAERTPWGWCCVVVTASYAGLSACDSLGGCSYESEADFKRPGDYYDDMVGNALDQLAVLLAEADAQIAEVRS